MSFNILALRTSDDYDGTIWPCLPGRRADSSPRSRA